MKYKELMNHIKKRTDMGLEYIRASRLAQELNITVNHASKDLQRCWRMGLLCRKRQIDRIKGGDFYIYYISKSGFNFLNYGFKNQDTDNTDSTKKIIIFKKIFENKEQKNYEFENNIKQYIESTIVAIKTIIDIGDEQLASWAYLCVMPVLQDYFKNNQLRVYEIKELNGELLKIIYND